MNEELNAVEIDMTTCSPGSSVAGVPILFQTLHLMITAEKDVHDTTYRSYIFVGASASEGRRILIRELMEVIRREEVGDLEIIHGRHSREG